MKTKNIFKTLVLAAVLVSACGKNEIADDFKGYTLPVTINVTRQGDEGTRATYDGETGYLSFSAGDQLFVSGHHGTAGFFAGLLAWKSGGTFSGTIKIEDTSYAGSANELLASANYSTATLVPANYADYGFLDVGYLDTPDMAYASPNYYNAYAPTKKEAVEQLSLEFANYAAGTGFALAPQNAILSFTVSGLDANEDVNISFNYTDSWSMPVVVSKTTKADALGNVTFAVAVEDGINRAVCSLNVDGDTSGKTAIFNDFGTSGTLVAGHIYNISRSVPSVPDGAISGVFSVSNTKKVYFSQGNLQYQASTSTWRFAEHQYDYVGDASNGNVYVESTKSNNASISETYTGWIDLFGWGTSGKTFASGYGSAYQPWSTSTTNTDYGPIGTYNLTDTYANGDWGVNMGSGWRTLSSAEWGYLFNTRTVNNGQGSGKSYTSGQRVNDVLGVVLYPDDYTGTTYTTGSDWSTFESAGCVFLPAAGYRNGTSVYNVGSLGFFWSSTAFGTTNAYIVTFGSDGVSPLGNGRNRDRGLSVRLVRQAE